MPVTAQKRSDLSLGSASVQQFSDSNVCRILLKQHFLPDAVTTHAAKALLVVRAQSEKWHCQGR